MGFKEKIRSIPVVPLTALLFYFSILVLSALSIIPSPTHILSFLESLHTQYGSIGLFSVVLLEGIVYLGLYFPGSFIVALIILLSDGSFLTLLSISLIVSFALTITSLINYVLGRHLLSHHISQEKVFKEFKQSQFISKGFLLAMIHPVPMGFYFLNEGIRRRPFFKILWIPIIMAPYTFFLAYVLISFKILFEDVIQNEYVILTLLLLWIIIAFIFEKRKKSSVGHYIVKSP